MSKLSERIVELRKALNINQQTFAEMIGVSNSKQSTVEKGENTPLFTYVEEVLNAFPQVNAEWLVKGTGAMFVGGVAPAEPLPVAKKEKAGQVTDKWAEALIANLERELNDAKKEKDRLFALLEK